MTRWVACGAGVVVLIPVLGSAAAGTALLGEDSGPLSDDGSLDPALRPRARWLTGALHRALPRVRVQAWPDALVGGGHLDLADPATRWPS